jgi:hypothetical protein
MYHSKCGKFGPFYSMKNLLYYSWLYLASFNKIHDLFPLMMISTCKGPILKSFSFIFPFSLMISQSYLLLLKTKKMIRYTKLIKLFKHWHKKVPNIKWLVSFDGRYLPSAYVGIFSFNHKASYPNVKICACEWEKWNCL